MDFYTAQQSKFGKKYRFTPFTQARTHCVNRAEFMRVLFIRTLGNFLILFSIYMLTWVFWKPFVEEAKYAYDNVVGTRYVVMEDVATFSASTNEGEKGLLNQVLGGRKVEPLIPKDPYFSVIIPKLGANVNIVANVNAADKDAYMTALQRGVAHAAGTALPGQNEHVYLFAHSTNTFSNVSRYNAVFYLLYKLDQGDEINLYYKGIRHKYVVTGKEVVDPSQVGRLTQKTSGEMVTLQTCWPPGTIAKRLLIYAEPVVK